eukprot:gene9189-19051_t
MIGTIIIPPVRIMKRPFSQSECESDSLIDGKEVPHRPKKKLTSNGVSIVGSGVNKLSVDGGKMFHVHIEKLYSDLPSSFIPPDKFLDNMLQARGYCSKRISAANLLSIRSSLSLKQLQDYDQEFVNATRTSDLSSIIRLHQEGRSMTACNKFGESILHLACRRATIDVVKYLLSNGGDLRLVDDYGRNPLHDACWRGEPHFEIISLIMDRDLDLIKTQDVRGATPLNYVRREHWGHWCEYLYSQREKYWSELVCRGAQRESSYAPPVSSKINQDSFVSCHLKFQIGSQAIEVLQQVI